MGVDDPEDDPSVLVERPGTASRASSSSASPNRRRSRTASTSTSRATTSTREVARLVGLGARVVGEQPDWVMLHDPEGNEFDVMR